MTKDLSWLKCILVEICKPYAWPRVFTMWPPIKRIDKKLYFGPKILLGPAKRIFFFHAFFFLFFVTNKYKFMWPTILCIHLCKLGQQIGLYISNVTANIFWLLLINMNLMANNFLKTTIIVYFNVLAKISLGWSYTILMDSKSSLGHV